MRKVLLISFILFVPLIKLLAQENLVDGYIITISSDTVYGQIDLRTSTVNQQKCVLVTNDNQKQTYLPGDIKGYRYSDVGKMYISKNVELNDQELLIFAEYLVQGGLNLFYLEYDKQGYYLFEEDGKQSLYVTQGSPRVDESKVLFDTKYKGKLMYYFKESSKTTMKLIESSGFNQKSMIAIAKQYNDENCLNPDQASCIIFENKAPDSFGIRIKFSAYTGVQNGTYYGHLSEGSSMFPLIGGQIYAYNPRWSNSFGVLLDLSFSRIEKEQSKLKKEYVNRYKYVDYDMFDLSAKLGVRYTYSKHRLRPSIEGGLGLVYVLTNNSSFVRDNFDKEPIVREYDVRKFHIGWYVGAGIEYNILKDQFIFARLNYDGYMKSDMTQVNGEDYIGLWQLKVGYTF